MLVMPLLVFARTATYTYILLLIPMAVLLRGSLLPKTLYLFASYSILNLFSPPALFLKIWTLLLLFFVVGYPYLRAIEMRWAMVALAALCVISAMDAQCRMKDYAAEPTGRSQQVAVDPG